MKSVKILSVSALLFASTGFSQAFAITRSCDAAYVLTNPATGGTITFGGNNHRFSAQGSCGSSVPNRCRKRARKVASECMKIHWERRWDGTRPEACAKGKGVNGYTVINVKKRLEKRACAHGWGQGSNITLRLRAKTWGSNGHCSSNTLLSSTYKITPAMCDNVGY